MSFFFISKEMDNDNQSRLFQTIFKNYFNDSILKSILDKEFPGNTNDLSLNDFYHFLMTRINKPGLLPPKFIMICEDVKKDLESHFPKQCIDYLLQSINSKNSELVEKEKANDELKQTVSELETSCTRFQSECNDLARDVNDYKRSIESLENENKTWEEKFEKGKNIGFEWVRSQHGEEIQKYKDEIAQLKGEIAELKLHPKTLSTRDLSSSTLVEENRPPLSLDRYDSSSTVNLASQHNSDIRKMHEKNQLDRKLISEHEKMLEEQKTLNSRLNSIAEEEEYIQKQKKLLEVIQKQSERKAKEKQDQEYREEERKEKIRKQDKENSQTLSYTYVDQHKYDGEYQDLVDSVENA